jgi:hypothetical protein
MLSLVPRSVAKGKGRTVGATTKISPVKPLPALEPETAAPALNRQELNDSGEDWEAIVALVTCTITSCTVADDFKIKLRTPQGCRCSTAYYARLRPAYSSASQT